MTRPFDPDLLRRLSEQRHQLIRTGSFGENYSATLDAYRLAQQNPSENNRFKPDSNSRVDPKRDYEFLE
jgi:hypothetical protein